MFFISGLCLGLVSASLAAQPVPLVFYTPFSYGYRWCFFQDSMLAKI
jgi:hypothetical protein